jgi:hypothetical protein
VTKADPWRACVRPEPFVASAATLGDEDYERR